MASSTTAWRRWSASNQTAVPARSVMNAWWRQFGHRVAWAPTRRVRAHDQPAARLASKGRLGHLGGPAVGVVDVGPGVLADGGDRRLDQLGLADCDREPDAMAAARADDLARPEPRVAPQRQRPGCPGPADPTGQLVDEPFGPAGGVGRAGAHTKVEQLPGVGPAGQHRVVAKPVGVAVGGPTLSMAVDLAHG